MTLPSQESPGFHLPAIAAPPEERSADQGEVSADQRDYEMRLSLNVLNHLGIYLYSNTAAVLSEVVANAWDADAKRVAISVDAQGGKVSVMDDGRGMNFRDINDRFLLVGYQKRSEEPGLTPGGRKPMGRKGIGKLSLFSVAREVLVETVKDGEKHAFRMTLEGIGAAIGNKDGEGVYRPEPQTTEGIDFSKGTRLTLSRLKKELYRTPGALRRRLARRFGVIGGKYDFDISLDGEPLSLEDRDYFHKVEFVWLYDDDGEIESRCSGLVTLQVGDPPVPFRPVEARNPNLPGTGSAVRGWIGTVNTPADLKDRDGDSLNKIVVMMRGKMAHEDILEEFGIGGLYTKYLIGEIHADFLDEDDQEDIATSSRQSIMEDAPRYAALKDFVLQELRHIETKWTEWRNRKGTEQALTIPAIDKWYTSLSPGIRGKARTLFGKIAQLPVEEGSRRRLLKFSVLAFENLRLKEHLDELDRIDLSNIHQVVGLLGELSDIEATFYHQIITQRVGVIRKLQEAVDDSAKERVIQEHVFKHLWLLDPSWERATDAEFMEGRVETIFSGPHAVKLTDEERAGRLDIKYKLITGKHVIIELKRSDRKVSTPELTTQIMKYSSAIRKVLAAQGRSSEPFEFVCVVGPELTDRTDETSTEQSINSLKAYNARVIRYDQLLGHAYEAYSEFLNRSREASRLMTLIREIDSTDLA